MRRASAMAPATGRAQTTRTWRHVRGRRRSSSLPAGRPVLQGEQRDARWWARTGAGPAAACSSCRSSSRHRRSSGRRAARSASARRAGVAHAARGAARFLSASSAQAVGSTQLKVAAIQDHPCRLLSCRLIVDSSSASPFAFSRLSDSVAFPSRARRRVPTASAARARGRRSWRRRRPLAQQAGGRRPGGQHRRIQVGQRQQAPSTSVPAGSPCRQSNPIRRRHCGRPAGIDAAPKDRLEHQSLGRWLPQACCISRLPSVCARVPAGLKPRCDVLALAGRLDPANASDRPDLNVGHAK